MIWLITGASHTGKTLLAQRLLETYRAPYLSIDHLKMGMIRSGMLALTVQDDEPLTEALWPVVREIVKTAAENRQHLILEMMRMNECGGVRVGAITEKTHLSRPAVSHHLQILKDAGLLKMRREGTKNYYYFDADNDSMGQLLRMLTHAKEIQDHLPDRRGAE